MSDDPLDDAREQMRGRGLLAEAFEDTTAELLDSTPEQEEALRDIEAKLHTRAVMVEAFEVALRQHANGQYDDAALADCREMFQLADREAREAIRAFTEPEETI